jgi:hypothetical protein
VIRIPTARRVADVFWPDFEERDGAVHFRVYVTKYDDPIVHFHQVRPGEQPWLSDAAAGPAVARDELAVYEAGRAVGAPAS